MLGKWEEQSFVRIQECDLRLLACDCSCLSHFSIVVLRHHDQGNVEKSSLGADSARGLRVHGHQGKEHGNGQAAVVQEQWLRAYVCK